MILDGQESPIAGVQRTQSTLATRSAVPSGTNVARIKSPLRDSNCSTTNTRSLRTHFCVGEEPRPPTKVSDSNRDNYRAISPI